ncbi:MAG: hypothetical protein WEB06_19440 [Actinomycetota bacterium]
MTRRRTARRWRHHRGDRFADVERASKGNPMGGVLFGGQEVIVHDDDVPAKDLTTVDGIPCTTALRTVIDIAPDVDEDHLERIVQDCLERSLFTAHEVVSRLAEDDMRRHPGAVCLRRLFPR